MAEYDLVAADLAKDPHAVVVMQMDDFNHIQWIRVQSVNNSPTENGLGRTMSHDTLKKLVADGLLLTANRLTEERTWVHAQPDKSGTARRMSL